MNVTRRDVVVGSVVGLGAASLLLGDLSRAAAGGEEAVMESVEILREGIFKADKAKLDQVTSPDLSYGHSDGRVETKDAFMHGVTNRKQTVKSLAFPEIKTAVVGNAAVVRHIYLAESELDGKVTHTKIGALQVWQKQDGGHWKLLARQGFRLPA